LTDIHLTTPIGDSDVESLRVGDNVYLSGKAFTCRSRLHRYIFDENRKIPFSTSERHILIHAGPIVVKENEDWKLISIMPTSSLRFEKWGASSVDEWNLKVICGKTTMGESTMKMMKEKKCVHVCPNSVSPNLWIDSITIEDVFLFDELGSIEAAWILRLKDFGPFIVDIDCEGNNIYEKVNQSVDEKLLEVYKQTSIPTDFDYTKLYQ